MANKNFDHCQKESTEEDTIDKCQEDLEPGFDSNGSDLLSKQHAPSAVSDR
jgi:hypothetical protein